MGNLNFNQICGKLIQDARIKKNLTVEDIAFYMLPKDENETSLKSQEIEELKGTELEKKVENAYLRKKYFEDVKFEKMYQENVKKINYWEKGNGYPDLNEIYKLAEIIDIDPNEIYKYRELDRKNLKGEKSMSKWKYHINRLIDDNLETLKILFPALVFFIIIYFLFVGAGDINQMIKTVVEIIVGGNQ